MKQVRRSFDILIGLAIVLLVIGARQAQSTSGPLPVTGIPVPELAVFDQAMLDYMNARGYEAGILAVMKDGIVVFERGYGWKDPDHTTPLPPDALMRIASVTKPITAAAIHQLISQGQLNASDRVFCVHNNPSPCWLHITPFDTPDPRLKDVTVQHLLDHKGGWDRGISGDPMFRSITIANGLDIESPPDQEDITRYMMGRSLDHTPGATAAYSNFGYLLLGLIVEEVTGQDYTAYIQDNIFAPLNVPNTEIELGRTLPEHRNPREPWYSSQGSGRSVFPPHDHVPRPDGNWYLEAMEAHGGLISSGRALLEFAQAYWLTGIPRANNGQNWIMIGSLDGTYSLLRWRPDGVNIVAIFNNRDGANRFAITPELDAAADSVIDWPTTEPSVPISLTVVEVSASDHDGNVPENTVDGDLETRWSAKGNGQWIQYDLGSHATVEAVSIAFYKGDMRQAFFDVHSSIDGVNWTPVLTGAVSSGTTVESQTFRFDAVTARYVRLIGYGNSLNGWNSYTEVEILGSRRSHDAKLPVSSVTASADDGNVPENALDGDLETRWSAEGDGQWIQFDLGDSKRVSKLLVAFYKGNIRTATFDIEVSEDAIQWTPVPQQVTSSGTTLGLQEFDFDDVSAQYVRIVGFGNSFNDWNSYTEVEIWGSD